MAMFTGSTFSFVALFALSAMVVNSIGIWVIYKNKQWVDRHIEYFMCFAVGVLIYVSAGHLLPEAEEHDKEHSYLAFLCGVALALFIMFSER
jgi:ZIP family zinc transporter/zinc and cadmium transporter